MAPENYTVAPLIEVLRSEIIGLRKKLYINYNIITLILRQMVLRVFTKIDGCKPYTLCLGTSSFTVNIYT